MTWRFIHDIDPFVVHVSEGFGVRWFALPVVAGFLGAYWALRRGASSETHASGLQGDQVAGFMLWLMTGVIVGARAVHVLAFDPDAQGADPIAWVAFWRGGLSTQGGLLGGATATWLFARRFNLSVHSISDPLIAVLALALGFSKLGDFLNGTGFGIPYEGPLCVDYSRSRFIPNPPSGCRHATQLYEAGKDWAIFGAVLVLGRFSWARRPGVATWTLCFLYGTGRLLLTPLRDEPEWFWGGSPSSWLSAGMVVLGGAMLLRLGRSPTALD
jgi:phosphatidylglycerol:prolipoprotein diacylglycerol transferase